MAEKKKEEEGEGQQPAAKPKSKKMLFIIIGVVVLLGAGGAFFFINKSNKAAEEAAKQAAEEVHPRELKRIKLDPFVVNLSEAKSFLKVTILLEYDPEVLARVAGGEAGGAGHGGGAAEEGAAAGGEGMPPQVAEKEPILRDKIISVLSSKTPSDVLSVTGKQALKDEIIEAVNDTLEFPEPVVVGVYFTEFMIQ